MHKDSKLIDFVLHLEKGIPEDVCKQALDLNIKKEEWHRGRWYSYGFNTWNENTHTVSQHLAHNELFCKQLVNWRDPYFTQTGVKVAVGRRTHPVLNKYEVGDYMDSHCDHIHSIFDGKLKGIPILTTLGVLNNDFEGGDFVMWGDYKFDLKIGDILAFPSIYTYPHEVKKVTKGIRYSWICWWF